MKQLVFLIYGFIRRAMFCPFGLHVRVPGPDGNHGNFCFCGKLLNPEAYKTYVVYLTDETQYQVTAINKTHAMNLVVYGEDKNKYPPQADIYAMRNNVFRVHPLNIASIVEQMDK
jgi:hypothetical protein